MENFVMTASEFKVLSLYKKCQASTFREKYGYETPKYYKEYIQMKNKAYDNLDSTFVSHKDRETIYTNGVFGELHVDPDWTEAMRRLGRVVDASSAARQREAIVEHNRRTAEALRQVHANERVMSPLEKIQDLVQKQATQPQAVKPVVPTEPTQSNPLRVRRKITL